MKQKFTDLTTTPTKPAVKQTAVAQVTPNQPIVPHQLLGVNAPARITFVDLMQNAALHMQRHPENTVGSPVINRNQGELDENNNKRLKISPNDEGHVRGLFGDNNLNNPPPVIRNPNNNFARNLRGGNDSPPPSPGGNGGGIGF